jgi:hypothetical protein
MSTETAGAAPAVLLGPAAEPEVAGAAAADPEALAEEAAAALSVAFGGALAAKLGRASGSTKARTITSRRRIRIPLL